MAEVMIRVGAIASLLLNCTMLIVLRIFIELDDDQSVVRFAMLHAPYDDL
jgi:hypothetical protein